MRRKFPAGRILFILLLCSPLVAAWSQTQEELRKRQEKLELILRFQDLRTIHDGKLLRFLSDRDPAVRERAVRAFASIQDTSVIPLLVNALVDRDTSVQYAAAFAVGQTAGQLSLSKRQRLEHDLIWSWLDQSAAADRLVEEVGKFGTEQALNDLLLRFANAYPPRYTEALLMSVARFAIRGISSADAVRYALKFIKPVDEAPWRAVYALQRIGDHEETRRELEFVAQLYKSPDPLVRMHAATLLGKVKDKRLGLEPLRRLAEFDGDWRVRVNAFRALANLDLVDEEAVLRAFRRAFLDPDMHVAVTAISAFGNAAIKNEKGTSREIFELLGRIARNPEGHYTWQVQGEAAIALAKLSGRDALQFITPTGWPQRFLQYDILVALGQTGAVEAERTLSAFLSNNEPVLVRGALDGLQALARKNRGDTAFVKQIYDRCLQSLRSEDMAVLTTASSMLGDSLFLSRSSVPVLLQALGRLRYPHDIEPMQEIISTLGKIGDTRAVERLKQYMKMSDRSVALAAASALRSITGQDYSSRVPRWFEPVFTDFDFRFMRTLAETVLVTIETIRGDIHAELYKDAAPFTVMSLVKLSKRGFYRGLTFHRVVPNFVVQGGDPRGDGWGGPGYALRSEFSPLSYGEGFLGIASAGKDTEGSQFFITHSPQPHLDGRYTIFGRVTGGMDVVNRIQVEDRIFDVRVIQ